MITCSFIIGNCQENFYQKIYINARSYYFQTLEQETNFDDAVKRLSFQHFIAPEYIIVGGVKANEGAIITRYKIKKFFNFFV